ncbi:MAG: ribosomal protein S18-alanine N-acetyltransferase [Oscillospiraceae bacterium]|nr:ribosomal protein S18-alanine N-acetyltransferase [Oscillospiraceae bacterium]
MTYGLQPLTAERLDDLLELEKLCFAHPWSREMFRGELENECAVYLLAVTEDDRIIGYAGLQVVLDEGYITNVAVHPDFRRQGVATALLSAFRRFGDIQGLRFLTLEVRESNAAAVALYGSLGYCIVGRRRNYYEDPQEDALLMTCRFSGKGEDA